MTRNKIIKLILLIVGIILLLVIVGLSANIIRFTRLSHYTLHLHRHTTTISDVNNIRDWMTFSYLNKIFKIPDNYLKSQLNISDSGYPNITISRAAKSQNVQTGVFLEKVKEAVRNVIPH